MTLQYANYWLTHAEMPRGTEGSPQERVDVAVIGAGFAGLSAALTLAKRGIGVVVLEAKTIGWGASCRNGGMVLTGLKLGVDALVAHYGIDVARRMYTASLASIDRVEQFVREEGIDCDFRRCGHLEAACKPSHFEAYARAVEVIARDFRHELRIVPPQQLAQEIGSQVYFGGLVDQVSAGVQPARYVAGLGRAALKAGASIYENCPVERFEQASRNGDSGFTVFSSGRKIFAKEIFVATGAYTVSIAPAIRRKIIPIGSYIIATEPLPETLARELSPRNRMIFDSRHYLHYFRLTPDGRMLFGGRAGFLPETTARVDRSAEILRRDMVKVYPQLRQTAVEYVWGGTLDFCVDTMPHAGTFEGIHYALGFAGHGVAMATYLGSQVARHIAGDDGEQPFDKIAFPDAPVGLHGPRPWLLPLAGAFYKVLDWTS